MYLCQQRPGGGQGKHRSPPGTEQREGTALGHERTCSPSPSPLSPAIGFSPAAPSTFPLCEVGHRYHLDQEAN